VAEAGGTLVTGGTIVTFDPPSVESRDLVLGAWPRTRIDASGCVVFPGLVNAHTHLYSGLARGMPAPDGATLTFREVLEKIWWRLDAALDADTLRASADVALLDAALSGVTAMIDHHESPSFVEGSLEVLFQAARAVGVSLSTGYGASDRHGHAAALLGLMESDRALAAGRPATLALHAGFTVEDETLQAASRIARERDAWVHVHAAEDRCDDGSFGRLERAGLVGERTILAHGVHLTRDERARAAAAGATVVHCPRSNLQNGVGYADVASFPGRVALGTDGMDGDLLAEARVAHLRAREAYGPAGGFDALSLLAGSQRLADELLGPRPEDWVVAAYDPPAPLDAGTLAGHLLFGLGARHVRDVIARGRPIVRHREPVFVHAAEVHARAREEAARLYRRMT